MRGAGAATTRRASKANVKAECLSCIVSFDQDSLTAVFDGADLPFIISQHVLLCGKFRNNPQLSPHASLFWGSMFGSRKGGLMNRCVEDIVVDGMVATDMMANQRVVDD
jgi:hypothetical protein